MSKPEGYKIKINNKNFTHPDQFIRGAEIKTYDNVPSNHEVFLKVSGPGKDKPIADNEQVNLDLPGTEHFFTTPTTLIEG